MLTPLDMAFFVIGHKNKNGWTVTAGYSYGEANRYWCKRTRVV